MRLALSKKKVLGMQNRCPQLIVCGFNTTVMVLTKYLEKLTFTAQEVLSGRYQCKFMKNEQTQTMR